MTSDSSLAPLTQSRINHLDPLQFIDAVTADPDLLLDDSNRERHTGILNHSSVCSFCGVGCSYTVEKDKKGNRRIHALSTLGLCVKGKTSLQTGGDRERVDRLSKRSLPDDRIRVPMMRGHDGKMHEVSWDAALDRAAWLFLHAREWVGPEAVAVYGNGQKTMEAIWMASLYKLVFRLPTMGANSEHCLTSAGAAHVLNFGNEASFTSSQFDELSLCDVAVLHGTNAFVTFPQAYEKLASNTAAVKVVIDPIRSDTVTELEATGSQTLHIRFRQGGDVLFNLAVARIILENGWQDDERLAQQVDAESLKKFEVLCKQPRCELSAVANSIALPGQDPEDLVRDMQVYASLIAQPRDGYRPKVAYVSSMGINQSTGSYGFSSNLNLLLLTGNVGRTGAGSLRIAGQSNATSELMMGFNARKLLFNLDPENDEHRQALSKVLDLPLHNIPSSPGTSVSCMSDDDHLYCFLFIGTQMTKNMPRVGHWTRRMGRSFNIVIDSFLGEGVLEHADVLLPSYTYTERTGVIQRGDRTMQLQQQLTEPPPQAWSDSKILARLALKIAERLRDPDTAELNDVDADVVTSTFSPYLDEQGEDIPEKVFDHIVAVNRELNLYSKLENVEGEPVSHHMLRQSAGRGVQWGSNKRYHPDDPRGPSFPGLQDAQRNQAKLVCPPNEFLDRLAAPLPSGTLSLISGRGRPGIRASKGRGRYNSGIKTLPIYGRDPDEYFVEIHPDVAQQRSLTEGKPVRMLSAHGVIFATVSFNERIAPGTAFIDFVPGEVNRLTDYVEADQFTHQSLIKRTPVELRGLRPLESACWEQPDHTVFNRAVNTLYRNWRERYATDEEWIDEQRNEPRAQRWLPTDQLRNPANEQEQELSEAVGVLGVFFQRYSTCKTYKEQAARLLRELKADNRDHFLLVFLPLVRRLDYQSVLHPVLSDLVGCVTVMDAQGETTDLDLLTAHKSAVLEFKEEIVAIQLFIAIKRALDKLYGPGALVKRENLAFVSGVAIPCAGDVPAHFLGISPAELSSALLVHSRAIGNGALIVADRISGQAVRIDVVTGVLPKDKELGRLRGIVINHKRRATGDEHRRFFDRLGELIVDYVRTGDKNFDISNPTPFNWEEYQSKLSFSPANKRQFLQHLIDRRVSTMMGESLTQLGVLDRQRDAQTLECLRGNTALHLDDEDKDSVFDEGYLYAGTLEERVERVVSTIISPVLENDGGRLDILDLNNEQGILKVRFVGSCANCPYSLLSMEQIVKPTLLAIPGITEVVHRAKARDKDFFASGLDLNTNIRSDLSCNDTGRAIGPTSGIQLKPFPVDVKVLETSNPSPKG